MTFAFASVSQFHLGVNVRLAELNVKVLVGTFNQEKALVIVKTDGSFAALLFALANW